MMSRLPSHLSFALFLALSACSSQFSGEVHRWSKNQPDPQGLQEAFDELEHAPALKMEYQGFEVHRGWQRDGSIRFSQFPIHGVRGPNGEWEEVTYRQGPELSLLQRLKMHRLQGNPLKQQKARFAASYPKWKLVSAQVDLIQDEGSQSPESGFVLVAFTPDETDVKSFVFNASGELLRSESVAHRGIEGRAEVFPGSPDTTSLDWRNLPGLKGDGHLNGERVQLISEKPEVAFSAEHLFRIAPQEPLFDDVQAYYFADRTLLWFEDKLNLRLPTRLEVKVHVGHPRQTNTAFYYDHKVRLGNGDGVAYRQIPRDPTIVSHEVAHAFVQQLSGLPFQGQGGSLNEAFADYFAADITGQSQMGGFAYLKANARRDLRNTLKFSDLKGALYGDSLVFSGTLWQLREELGAETFRPLVVLSLMVLGPLGQHKDFGPILRRLAQEQLGEADRVKLNAVLESRGFPEPETGDLEE